MRSARPGLSGRRAFARGGEPCAHCWLRWAATRTRSSPRSLIGLFHDSQDCDGRHAHARWGGTPTTRGIRDAYRTWRGARRGHLLPIRCCGRPPPHVREQSWGDPTGESSDVYLRQLYSGGRQGCATSSNAIDRDQMQRAGSRPQRASAQGHGKMAAQMPGSPDFVAEFLRATEKTSITSCSGGSLTPALNRPDASLSPTLTTGTNW